MLLYVRTPRILFFFFAGTAEHFGLSGLWTVHRYIYVYLWFALTLCEVHFFFAVYIDSRFLLIWAMRASLLCVYFFVCCEIFHLAQPGIYAVFRLCLSVCPRGFLRSSTVTVERLAGEKLVVFFFGKQFYSVCLYVCK